MVMWRWRGLSVSAAMRSPRRRGHSAAVFASPPSAFSQRAAATGSTVIAIDERDADRDRDREREVREQLRLGVLA